MASGTEARIGGFSPAALLSPGTEGKSFNPRIEADNRDYGDSALLGQARFSGRWTLPGPLDALQGCPLGPAAGPKGRAVP
jgi:hypothetical protein